jgi:hypothetical protein
VGNRAHGNRDLAKKHKQAKFNLLQEDPLQVAISVSVFGDFRNLTGDEKKKKKKDPV